MENHSFTQEVDAGICYSSVAPKGYSIELHSTEIKFKYSVNFETREYGFKGIDFSCPDQEVTCYIALTDEDGESDSHLVTLKLSDNTVDHNGFGNSSLYPTQADLEITKFTKVGDSFFAEGSIEISFEK